MTSAENEGVPTGRHSVRKNFLPPRNIFFNVNLFQFFSNMETFFLYWICHNFFIEFFFLIDKSCEICQSADNEDQTLLCDSCDAEYHMYCLTPPLQRIPKGKWYCPRCFQLDMKEEDYKPGIDFVTVTFLHWSSRSQSPNIGVDRKTTTWSRLCK